MALGNDSGYDEDDILSVKNVQCINMATGEVLEWDVSTDTAMAMAYDEITQDYMNQYNGRSRYDCIVLAMGGQVFYGAE